MVIAIIAILAAMLLPALSKAREKARAISCTNHIRQSLQSMQFYIDDYSGVMMIYTTVNGTISGHISWARRLYLNEYLPNPTIAVCPVNAPTKWTQASDGHVSYTYGMARYTGDFIPYYGSTAYSIPSNETRTDTAQLNFYALTSMKLVVGDSFSVDPAFMKQTCAWSISGGGVSNLLAFDHGGRGNFGWSDGHVTSMTPQEVKDETDDRMKAYAKAGVRVNF